mmetsp:Transcript_12642/g.30646  ORF Transcript_12642/g.30646 Transcript_12642/m.30646 type:complete len:157 (+) Transcript_12642:260-730(+)
MPTAVDSQDLNDLLGRIKKLERDVRRLKDAQICNPSVVIDDVLNTTTNETIDQIVTCRYRDDLVDHVEFGQTNVAFNGTTTFNDTVTVKEDVSTLLQMVVCCLANRMACCVHDFVASITHTLQILVFIQCCIRPLDLLREFQVYTEVQPVTRYVLL